MKLLLLFALLFIQKVFCANIYNVTYYETNFVLSDVQDLYLHTCETINDCPNYAIDCISIKNFKPKVCSFEFRCRANYRCVIPDSTLAVKSLLNSNNTEIQNTKTLVTDTLIIGEEVKYNMRSCSSNSSCMSKECSENNDCYSKLCDKKVCRVNKDIKEYYCGFPTYDVGNKVTEKNVTETHIKCRNDKEQTCTKNDECYTNKCDYTGICVTDYMEESQRKYDNEKKRFYVFLVIILLFILFVIIGSFYHNRKYVRKAEDEEKKRRLLNNNDDYVDDRRSFKKK